MLSTDQNAVNTGPPKRFLRKGEGLKRFAAYKPPLPTTTKKVERRQTFVRFRLDPKNLGVRREPAHFVPPDILNDDSINLSTEIPKIAPPKIIHTPIRPSRHALGTLTNESSLFNESQINGNIDSLFKKIEEKKSTLNEKDDSFFDDHSTSFSCQHHDDNDNDKDHDNYNVAAQHLQQRDTSTPSRHQIIKDEPVRQPKRQPKQAGRMADLSTPAPGTSIVALGKQIYQIESTVNELREKLKKCECGAMAQPSQTIRRRPTTRAAARAAKSKESDNNKSDRPSADADNNPIEKLILSLADHVAQLKLKYDEEIERRNY